MIYLRLLTLISFLCAGPAFAQSTKTENLSPETSMGETVPTASPKQLETTLADLKHSIDLQFHPLPYLWQAWNGELLFWPTSFFALGPMYSMDESTQDSSRSSSARNTFGGDVRYRERFYGLKMTYFPFLQNSSNDSGFFYPSPKLQTGLYVSGFAGYNPVHVTITGAPAGDYTKYSTDYTAHQLRMGATAGVQLAPATLPIFFSLGAGLYFHAGGADIPRKWGPDDVFGAVDPTDPSPGLKVYVEGLIGFRIRGL